MENIQEYLVKHSGNRRERQFTWQHMLSTLAYWTLSSGIQDVLRPLYAQLQHRCLSEQDRRLIEQNRELRNRHAGHRCFILATGPSIKMQDLTLLKHDMCIAVSNFFVHPDYAVIHPQYHCMAPYHPPITEEAFQAWLDELAATCGDTEVFFGVRDYERVHRQGRFADQRVYYLNFTGSWRVLLKNGIELTRPIPAPQSVTVMALCIALYMGCRPIYLLGCDHDSISHVNESRHFYDESQHVLQRKGYSEWYADVEEQCRCYVNLWQAYKAVNFLAQQNACQIFNATIGGMLDVFERTKYESLF